MGIYVRYIECTARGRQWSLFTKLRWMQDQQPNGHGLGMFNECLQGYPRQMNQHAVSTEPGGYIFAFSISRRWLRKAGSWAIAAGVVVSVVANATEPFRAPLGIALGVLAIPCSSRLQSRAPHGGGRRNQRRPKPARAGNA